MNQKKERILVEINRFSQILPAPFYWLDLEQKYLGLNDLAIRTIGGVSYEENFLNKTPYDIYPNEMAKEIVEHHQLVLKSRKILYTEESIKVLFTNTILHFDAIIAPLFDHDQNIIGTIGTSIDITTKKEQAKRLRKEKIFEHLQVIASVIPVNVYWLDTNNIILGANKSTLKAVGVSNLDKIIGKTVYNLYPKAMADNITSHHTEVRKNGKTFSEEELIEDIKTKKLKYFNATMAPLYDDDGHIIGTIGTSIDITSQKESELLKLENSAQKAKLSEQTKFTKIANQVAHDIRSPLASLLMIIKSCTEIPEADRIALREAATSIGDIANHLLHQYRKNDDVSGETDESQPVLISAVLLQLLTDKKYQYQDLAVRFIADFSQSSHFAFVNIQPSAFKRMLSNLLNNAVDAFEHQEGRVVLTLNADKEWINIIIQDNGKGMTPEVVEKIRKSIPVTVGKKTGHGIGLTQVHETLAANHGALEIDSVVHQGTTITLTFARIMAPQWIAEEINLGATDLVVILDDDNSIHGAWRTHFDPILKTAPKLQLKHFTSGKEALVFLESLTRCALEQVFLLTDYELLKQELNGLDIVAKSKIKRSILVTSHYANSTVRDQAARLGTKILPKQLASETPIKIHSLQHTQLLKSQTEKVEIVIVDDDERYIQSLINFVFCGKKVAAYCDPHHFLANLTNYPKATKIYLDNNFVAKDLKGLAIAEQLHTLGYTCLYLLSGENFAKAQVPNYITVIRKDDIAAIQSL